MNIELTKEYQSVLQKHGKDFADEWKERLNLNEFGIVYVRPCDIDSTLIDVVSDTDNWSFISYKNLSDAVDFCSRFNLKIKE